VYVWGRRAPHVPAPHFKVHPPFRLGPYILWAGCGRICNSKIYKHGHAQSVEKYIPRFDIAVSDPPFLGMQIRDTGKDLMDNRLCHQGKAQDVLSVMRHIGINNWGKRRDREKVGERKGHKGHPKSL
jgi:hypothetical protein